MRTSFRPILAATLAVAASAALPAPSFAVIDLAIESARAEPAQGTPSTAFTFAVQIKNRGNTQAKIKPGCFRYRLPADPSYSSTDVKNPTPNPYVLGPGQTVECKGQPKTALPAGLLSIEFVVESDISQPDTNNQNNRYYIQVPVANASGYVGKPDLYFSKPLSFSTGKSAAGVGEEVSVYAYLGNKGDGDALIPKGTSLWTVSENGKLLAQSNTYDQGVIYKAGMKDAWTWAKLPPLSPGTHNLVVNLDPQNVVKEKNDTHQPTTVTLNIMGPDLSVTMQSLAGKSFKAKDSIPLVVTVRNKGAVSAAMPQGGHFLYYGAKGYAVNKLILPNPWNLAPFGEYKTSLTVPPFTSRSGSYDIEVWVDPVNTLHDYNPADNKTSSKVSIVLESMKGAVTGSSGPTPYTRTAPSVAVPPKVVPKRLP